MSKQNETDVANRVRSALSYLLRQMRLVVSLALMLCVGVIGNATATSSDNYSVTETQFGNGAGELCSDAYCAQSSVGDTAVGDSTSDNYGALSGYNTTDEPLLQVTVGGGNQDLGTLDIENTGTVTMPVSVRTYLSGGYTLLVVGEPPSQGTHQLRAMDGEVMECPCTSNPGMEQFGINLVENSAPVVGADPLRQPSSQTEFGTLTADYTVPDLFKYEDGAAVAQTMVDEGQIDYTVSMILNISNVTPGGRYTGTFAAVVVPIY